MAGKTPKKGNARKTPEKVEEKRNPKYKNLKAGNKEHSFTSTNQPPPENKSKGKFVAKTLREMLSMPIIGKLPDDQETFLLKVQQAYGIERHQIDIRLFMEFRIAMKALEDGDVTAYKALLERAFGRSPEAKPIEDETGVVKKTTFDLGGGNTFEI